MKKSTLKMLSFLWLTGNGSLFFFSFKIIILFFKLKIFRFVKSIKPAADDDESEKTQEANTTLFDIFLKQISEIISVRNDQLKYH